MMLHDNVPAHRLMMRLDTHLARRPSGSGTEELVLDLAA
jgi:hypothetical protein